MYRLSIFFKHLSDRRVEEACDRVSPLLTRATRNIFTFSIEEPDEFNEHFMALGHLNVPNKAFVRIVVECLREEYCSVRIKFTKKAYGLVEGSIDGNAWNAEVNGPLNEIYAIGKALASRTRSPDDEPEIAPAPATKPTKYSHLSLVK